MIMEATEAPVKLNKLLSPEFLTQYQYLNSVRLADLASETFGVDCSGRSIRRARKLHEIPYKRKVKDVGIVHDPIEEEDLEFEEFSEVCEMMQELQKKLSMKTESVVITPEDPSKWFGMVLLGDLHLGSYRVNYKRLLHDVHIIQNLLNCGLVQLGDITSSEASMANRPQRREQPLEVPLNMQRKMAQLYFKRIDKKLVAFITGNHDDRSRITESFDLGEELVKTIEASYLGREGTITLRFSEELEYKLFVTHEGEGRSLWNPTHPALREFARDSNIDAMFFAHIHEDTAYIGIPKRNGRAIGVRVGGYMKEHGLYEEMCGFDKGVVKTPVVLFNPLYKQMIIIDDIRIGLNTLRSYLKDDPNNDPEYNQSV